MIPHIYIFMHIHVHAHQFPSRTSMRIYKTKQPRLEESRSDKSLQRDSLSITWYFHDSIREVYQGRYDCCMMTAMVYIYMYSIIDSDCRSAWISIVQSPMHRQTDTSQVVDSVKDDLRYLRERQEQHSRPRLSRRKVHSTREDRISTSSLLVRAAAGVL